MTGRGSTRFAQAGYPPKETGSGPLQRKAIFLMKSHDTFYTRQKYLFALVFVVVSIVPLLFLNYNASRFYQESWMEKTSIELSSLASDRRALIDRFLET